MEFITESFSYACGDGRIVLRACVDKPLYFDHIAYEYLNTYSSSIFDFVGDVLFLKATEAYLKSIRDNIRFSPFMYSLKCFVTYSDDLYSSFAMVAKLCQAERVLAQGIGSVVFHKEQIIPPKILFRSRKKQSIALDSEGFPCIAQLSDGKVIFKRVGKKSLIK